jgi:hypothetical protein
MVVVMVVVMAGAMIQQGARDGEGEEREGRSVRGRSVRGRSVR